MTAHVGRAMPDESLVGTPGAPTDHALPRSREAAWYQIDTLRRELDQARRERDGLERKYRERLWLGHGHSGQYGDDGEMQCAACLPYGLIDYKRTPLDKVESVVASIAMERIVAARAALGGA